MARRALLLSFALALAPSHSSANNWPPPAGADLSDPQNWPNDPGYAGQWNYWSFVGAAARTSVRPQELALGSGFHADEAWQQTTGDRRVLIAVLDSGIRWNSPDLVNKLYLNAGELPVPDAACGVAPAGHDPHDSNGDGIFNIQDYARPDPSKPDDVMTHLPSLPCDPRVSDTNGNGFIDPQDLIAAFSDGVDSDGNGYVDDISGWDMLEDDNDPNDDTDFGHGTGEAHDSSAEGNNNRSSLGVCPECTVMMVRVGDSFVADTDDFAMAVLYAVDRGAAVVQEALGAYDNSSFARAAIDYAYRENVTVIASAADEDSYHQNFPGGNQHTVYVHAIRYDSQSWQTAHTYLNFNNCTNYGGQLVLSTPGTGCSSEATGRTSGMAGLLYSAALAANLPVPRPAGSDPAGNRRLSAEEVKQLLVTTVDDIYLPDYDPITQYPSQPGWDQRFGYGRPNIGRAVGHVLGGQIPPEADIDEPDWFEVVHPDRTPMLPIVAHIDFRRDRYAAYDWVLEWAAGIEPPDGGAAWNPIANGNGLTDPIGTTTPLAMWDLSQVQIDNPPQPEPDVGANRYLCTLRLRVIAHSTNPAIGDVAAVMRKTIHIVRDPTLAAGYPVRLGASGESSPKIADLFGDGRGEIVIGDADGRVHVLGADGQEKPGWPFRVGALHHIAAHQGQRAFGDGGVDPSVSAPIIATPAVGDVDGDGRPDVVVATRGGELFALGRDGRALPGFPVEVDAGQKPVQDPAHIVDVGFFSSPVLYDLDGDGRVEIVIAAFDGALYAWHGDGSAVSGFPVPLTDASAQVGSDDVAAQRVMSTAAIGDIDGDGQPDIVIASTEHYSGNGRIYAIHADGMAHPGGPFLTGWPLRTIFTADVLPVVGNGIPNSAALGDVDGDGILDVVVMPIVGVPYVYRGDGARIATMQNGIFGAHADANDSPLTVLIANPSLGDVDGDGQLDVVAPAAGFRAASAFATGGQRTDFQHEVGAWRARDGQMLDAFPRRIEDWQFFGNPALADMNGDGKPDVIEGSAGYFVHAFTAAGSEPAGWPKLAGGWVITAPAVGDLDGDGKLEVAVATRGGWLYAWHTDGATSGRIDWASFHHDLGNTGSVKLPPLAPPGGTPPPNPGADSGCGCRVGGAEAPSGTAALGLWAGLCALSVSAARRRSRGRARRGP